MDIKKISGFPEYLPQEQLIFNNAVDIIKQTFISYGYASIETPAVERTQTLLAKGNDNEIYGLYRLADEESKKELALRFDLTVPLARYVVEHSNELIFPFKRFQIAPVWRGERAQTGRYRQFYQCDIDIINNGSLSLYYDAEIITCMYEVLHKLNIKNFKIKINNRKFLYGFLTELTKENTDTNLSIAKEIVKIIDKKDKISPDEFQQMLFDCGLTSNDTEKLNEFINAKFDLESLNKYMHTSANELLKSGIQELITLITSLKDPNIVEITTSLARGLDYYTGLIFEIALDDVKFGSIGGGGRYANLCENFSKEHKPGVGGSIGLSRLMTVLLNECKIENPVQVLVTSQDHNSIKKYIEYANIIRSGGTNVEVYLQKKNLGDQISYAEKKGIKYVVIANAFEFEKKCVAVKNLTTKEQVFVNECDLQNFFK